MVNFNWKNNVNIEGTEEGAEQVSDKYVWRLNSNNKGILTFFPFGNKIESSINYRNKIRFQQAKGNVGIFASFYRT